jgi:hypothetical protein
LPRIKRIKALAVVYLGAGCVLAILVLRVMHGQWDEFREIATAAAAANGFTAVLAALLFRKSASKMIGHRILLVACYLLGIAGGIYFYFT